MRKFVLTYCALLLITGYILFIAPIFLYANKNKNVTTSLKSAAYSNNELLIQFKSKIEFNTLSLITPQFFTGHSKLDSLNWIFRVEKIIPVFPVKKLNSASMKQQKMPQIYLFKFAKMIDSSKLIKHYQSLEIIEAVELNYYYFADNTKLIAQSSLNQLQLEKAASFIEPKNSIIIGIIDTGIDWKHKHIITNIWENPLEKSDGKDNDQNGLIDDIWGWNFNDPEMLRQFDFSWESQPIDDCGHGTQIAEIINQIGNYRPLKEGTNKNQLMILKAGFQSPDGTIIFTTFSTSRALIYAADNGAQIINLSWGGEYSSQILQQVIDYAVEKGCAIISSAGNKNSDLYHYPSAFENVWAVTATGNADKKLDRANYGSWVDIAAPGLCPAIPLFQDSTKSVTSGTSIAAAHVSGLAGLLLSCEDIVDSDSLKRRIIWSSENIYHKNPNYSGQMGAGRINVFRAFSSQHQPNIAIQNIFFNLSNQTQSQLPVGIVPLFISIKNLSSTAQNLILKLNTDDPYLTILHSEISLPELNYQQQYTNELNPFTLVVNDNYPQGYQAQLTISIETSNGFALTQDFYLPLEKSYPKNLSIINQYPVTLTWLDSPELIGYYIYKRNNNQPLFARINDIPILDSKYVDYDLETGYQYFYYITGIDSTGYESPTSDTVSIQLKNSISKLSVANFTFSPESDTTIFCGDSMAFIINSADDSLNFEWFINDKLDTFQTENSYLFKAPLDSMGSVTISVRVGGEDSTYLHQWLLNYELSLQLDSTITYIPINDTTIYEGDTLNLTIQFPFEHSQGNNYQWFINGLLDSSVTQSSYLFAPDYFSAGIDTVFLTYEMGDSISPYQWLITILNRNRVPEILSYTSTLDTTISVDDTLLFSITATDPDQDSLFYKWYVNERLDTTAIDSFYSFLGLDEKSTSDTIFVKISDSDTSIYQNWIVHYFSDLNQVPQIISYFPSIDSTVMKADSIQFEIHCDDPDGDTLQYIWILNSRVDTSAQDSTYLYRNIDSTFANDTLTVFIADDDTIISVNWILWADTTRFVSSPPKSFSCVPEQDSLFAEGDSLTFVVHNPNDSCRFQWTINGIIDSTVNDSIFIYHFPQDSSSVDTIQVTIFDQDTLFYHRWYVHYLNFIETQVPLNLFFKPEEALIVVPSDDSLKFLVQIIEGEFHDLSFLWCINNEIDTTAHDTIFYYQPNPSALKPDTVMIAVSRNDTTISYQWIVQLYQQPSLPVPHLIFPIAGNHVSEEDLLIWEDDSSLAQIDSIGSWNYLVQLSKDSTFTEIISTDSCVTTNIMLNNISGFDRIAIGQPIFWHVKIFSSNNITSEFEKCNLPFYYYPMFAEIENFSGEKKEDGSIELFWIANYEKNCAGFNIYRSESQDNDFKKVNEHLIIGEKSYSFHDGTTEAGKTYYYKLEDVSSNGRKQFHHTISITAATPKKYSLTQNFPNPFNSQTSFKYEIPIATHVTIAVYNVLGKKVKTLVDERKEPGFYIVYWDGVDDHGESVVSGVYFYHMSSIEFNTTRKMIVVR